VEEEDPHHRRVVEVPRRGGGPVLPPCHGGGGPAPPPRRGGGGPALPPCRGGGGGPVPWRRSPPLWRRATIDDPEGDEMPAHAEDRPSESYNSNKPWRALAVKLP
jgi:hypothetical protein